MSYEVCDTDSYITWPYQIADHNCKITWVNNKSIKHGRSILIRYIQININGISFNKNVNV